MAELPPKELSSDDSAVIVDESGATITAPKDESEVTRSTKQRISDIFTIVPSMSDIHVLISL